MPSKSLLKRGFKKKAEELAEKYRLELRISKFDPLCAFKLATHLDIPIFSVAQAFEGKESEPAFAVMNNPAKFSAMWMPNEDSEKIIIHNDRHSPGRQQSNIMHEISHLVLGHSIPDETAALCALYGLHYVNDLHEQEAKCLGGCLQITRPGLQWALKNLGSEEKIAEYYTASIDMVKYRINTTGVRIQQFRTGRQ